MSLDGATESPWSRIWLWVRSRVQDLDSFPPAGASDESIQELNRLLGSNIPSDLDSLLREVDGFDECGVIPSPDPHYSQSFCLLSANEIGAEWAVWKDLIDAGEFTGLTVDADDGIQELWWSEQWLPFAGNGEGDFLCVDLAPTEAGVDGQIIAAWHDDPQRQLLAPNLKQFLSKLADDMEANRLEYDSDDGVCYHADN